MKDEDPFPLTLVRFFVTGRCRRIRVFFDFSFFGRFYPDLAGFGRIWPDFSGFVRVFRFVFQVDSGFFGGFSEQFPVLAAHGVSVWNGPGLSFSVKSVTCK